MAVTITVTDGTGEVGDVITGWSVNEATTPANPSQNPDNTGSVSFSGKTAPDSSFLVDDNVTFEHEVLGTVSGLVGDITITDDVVAGTISKRLALLDVDRNMAPTSLQSLSQTITDYVAAVTDQITVSYTASNNPSKVFPGWSGSVWQRLNELCSLYKLEITISGTTMIVRDMGTTDFTVTDDVDMSRTITTRSAGLFIDVTYQQSELISSDSTYKWNYSRNPSLETNATGWTATVGAYGAITSGRVNN